MNYLVVDALKFYGKTNEDAQQMYLELRQNLVQNIFAEFKRTGTLHEQYNALNGQGQRSYPFTGWTSLVLLMLAEN